MFGVREEVALWNWFRATWPLRHLTGAEGGGAALLDGALGVGEGVAAYVYHGIHVPQRPDWATDLEALNSIGSRALGVLEANVVLSSHLDVLIRYLVHGQRLGPAVAEHILELISVVLDSAAVRILACTVLSHSLG